MSTRDIEEAARQMAQLIKATAKRRRSRRPGRPQRKLRPELSLEDKRRRICESACLDEMASELENRAKNDWADAEPMCLFLAGRCRARIAEIVHELGGQAALGPIMDALGWD